MRDAIFFEPEYVDKDVGSLMSKIKICKEMGWTPEQYGRQKYTELRKFKNYFKWINIKSKSKRG